MIRYGVEEFEFIRVRHFLAKLNTSHTKLRLQKQKCRQSSPRATKKSSSYGLTRRNSMVQHSIGLVGGIGHTPPEHPDPADLMFVFNPKHRQGFVSRFHVGVINSYAVEYDLERFRFVRFPALPSRLHAMYLFEDREASERYRITHEGHIAGRLLKRGVTSGPYFFSRHDLAWIDFLRLGHSMDADTLNFCWHQYWSGGRVQDHQLTSMGKPWKAKSINECLFYGRVKFPNKCLSKSD